MATQTARPNINEYYVLHEDGTISRSCSAPRNDLEANSDIVRAAIRGGWLGSALVAVPKFEPDVWHGFNLRNLMTDGLDRKTPARRLRMWFREDGLYDTSLRPNALATAAVVAKWLLDGHPIDWVREQGMIVGPCVIEVPSLWTGFIAKGMSDAT